MRIRSALPLLPLVIVPSTHCASGAMWRRSDGDEGLEAAERASLVAYLETL